MIEADGGWLVDLGQIDYDRALELQLAALQARAEERTPDTLLLLQHPAVITLGRSADPAHVLLPPSELARRGVAVREVGRGGDVTLHAPGQLVGYPIVDLKTRGRDVHRYLRDLEEVLILALSGWGIQAERVAGATGVWVRDQVSRRQATGDSGGPEAFPVACRLSPGDLLKVAAIGVGVKRWTTYHGFALNVDPDLALFGMIVPCGFHDRGVTSVSQLLGRPVGIEEAASRVAAVWPIVFPPRLCPIPAQRWESAIRGETSSTTTTSRKMCTNVGSH
jgi:lipoyl(octanoyl) transferase